MFRKAQIEEHSSLNANKACSTCEHVWFENEAISAVARTPPHFLVGCSEDCLFSENRIVVCADHLYDRSPDFLPLLHLPLYGKAILENRAWRLGILEVSVDTSEFKGSFYIQQKMENFFSKNQDYYSLFVWHELHYETLIGGARFVPVWTSRKEAEQYRRTLHFVSRILLKVKKVTQNQLLEHCHQDKQNYLAISHNSTTREALIVDDELNIEENTMQF